MEQLDLIGTDSSEPSGDSRQIESLAAIQTKNNGSRYYVGIPNQERRNEEALFDAINYFGKKCPYCQGALYEGNIRSKIEIDHFYPIAKGGQDLPWNILPICKKCNRTKRDKLPQTFLGTEHFAKIHKYLSEVRDKICGDVMHDLQKLELIRGFVEANRDRFTQSLELFEILELQPPPLPEQAKAREGNDKKWLELKIEEASSFFEIVSQKKAVYTRYDERYGLMYFAFQSAYDYYASVVPYKDQIPDRKLRRFIETNIAGIKKSVEVRIKENKFRTYEIDLSNLSSELGVLIGKLL